MLTEVYITTQQKAFWTATTNYWKTFSVKNGQLNCNVYFKILHCKYFLKHSNYFILIKRVDITLVNVLFWEVIAISSSYTPTFQYVSTPLIYLYHKWLNKPCRNNLKPVETMHISLIYVQSWYTTFRRYFLQQRFRKN